MVDYNKQVSMSTFIDDQILLLQFDQRYMIFDKNGNFVDECDFENHEKERNECFIEEEIRCSNKS